MVADDIDARIKEIWDRPAATEALRFTFKHFWHVLGFVWPALVISGVAGLVMLATLGWKYFSILLGSDVSPLLRWSFVVLSISFFLAFIYGFKMLRIFILVSAGQEAHVKKLKIQRLDLRFIAAYFLQGLILIGPAIIVYTFFLLNNWVGGHISESGEYNDFLIGVVVFIFILFFAYIIFMGIRLWTMSTRAALGFPFSPSTVWQDTKGHFGRLFGVSVMLFVLGIPFAAVHGIFSRISDTFMENAGGLADIAILFVIGYVIHYLINVILYIWYARVGVSIFQRAQEERALRDAA